MRTVFFASLVAVFCSITIFLLIACFADNVESEAEYSVIIDTDTTTERETEKPVTITNSNAQNILDTLYDKVDLKDGRIYLSFGARDTLTVENFNKLILEEQLCCTKGRFSFVINPSILTALKNNNAYGGIGFGQEWITTLTVQIKDTVNGYVSEPKELVLTLHKSTDADLKLRGYPLPGLSTETTE